MCRSEKKKKNKILCDDGDDGGGGGGQHVFFFSVLFVCVAHERETHLLNIINCVRSQKAHLIFLFLYEQRI